MKRIITIRIYKTENGYLIKRHKGIFQNKQYVAETKETLKTKIQEIISEMMV